MVLIEAYELERLEIKAFKILWAINYGHSSPELKNEIKNFK